MNDTLPARDGNFPADVQDLIDDAALAEFEDLADTIGLTEEQAQAVWDWIVEGALRFVGDLNADARAYCDEAEQEMRSRYGRGFEAKKKAVQNLIRKYGGDELAGFLKNSGIGNCCEIVDFLIKVADAADEDRGLAGEKAAEISGEDKIKAEIARLMAVPAYMQAAHPEHESVVRQVYGLRKRLFGEE